MSVNANASSQYQNSCLQELGNVSADLQAGVADLAPPGLGWLTCGASDHWDGHDAA